MTDDARTESAPQAPESPQAPIAAKHPQVREHHGHAFRDDYEWMREKDSQELLDHLAAENDYTAARTAHLAALREDVFDEIRARTKETDMSVPVRRGGHWHFARTFEGKDYPVQCRIPAVPGDWTPPALCDGQTLEGEEVVLDLNAEAAGHEFFSLGSFSLSSDGARLAWAADTTGDERYLLRVRDLRTGEDLPDAIPDTFGGAEFDRSGEFVFYTTVDAAWRPDTVWRHRVGTPASEDVRVFHEPDERYFVGMFLSRSERFVFFVTESKVTSGWWFVDAADPQAQPQPVWPRAEGVDYAVEHVVVAGEDRFLITTNRDRVDFDVLDVAVADPTGPERPVIGTAEGKRIEGVDAFEGFLALSYRSGGFARVGLIPLAQDAPAQDALARPAGASAAEAGPYGPLDEVEVDEPIGTLELGANPEWAQPTLRLAYGSLVTPATVFDLDVATGERTVLKRQEVLGGVDTAAYEQALRWATAADGTQVPISLVWCRDAVPAGWADGAAPAPVLLYGYGSYETSVDPFFSVPRLSLLDRGVVYAIAHVRGGGELGRRWYDEGKTVAKQNTFTDFIAAADHLIAAGLTEPARLVATGRSAGGLLMGAVANMGYDRFAGISAGVPFVDALTSILMPELPLTVIEWDEWGDPLHDPEVYAYMRSYSPYENVGEHPYPKILALTSLNDTRVLYVEPAKWVARLREVGADALLKTEMVAGHGGVSGRYDAWRERAFEYAWILDVLGVGGVGRPGHGGSGADRPEAVPRG
ncbi:prolyl oligopeptidase family serine peptidase [Brevibacterium sp. 5221]|uniref:Prolyl oligopeptidase family serine peptidase n=1 Tax=Brevibacterium rongguiense TaxID=2695267 RepID=A0A6N9H4U6_9MICO|nr:S9 family peptidase [Brevibacterium rongguiense]MYM18796.1 prolyl oligopeptidase family serine peptidase [Brevibacterium rongguiense]